MNTREDILELPPRNRWIGLGLGGLYLLCACVAFVVIPVNTALIWVAMSSPFLIIADELCAVTEISSTRLVRRSPLSPRIIIPWRKVKRVLLVRNRGNNRLVYIRARGPALGVICFTSKQGHFRDGLLRVLEIAECHGIEVQIYGLSRRREWEQWARAEG